ncbi:MAG TPA: glycolate oxidase subunit GlcE [Arenicellales bacterium]|nr:glycolate oxidase subunit GlcE [Arenicellales bacterium]
MSDFIQQTCEAIKAAADRGSALCVRGGGTRWFYGREIDGETLSTTGYKGIIDYEPSELVMTARCGTTVEEIEAALAEHGQMLPFEPPRFAPGGTIGGAIASGLSGPRRPYAGAARDAVLGCEIINGFGEHLAFGGQVMKNVAGYDISRLMVGALGTLGVITRVSMKVVPRPVEEITLAFDYDQGGAIAALNRWAGHPLPISGSCHDGERLYVRLSGAHKGVTSAAARLGGENVDDADFWTRIRDQRHTFFGDAVSVWRLSVPAATNPLDVPGATLIEWNGGLRWVDTDAQAAVMREAAAAAGGHAIHYRGHDGNDVFHPLGRLQLDLHRRLKRSFDPAGVLNPGRMYAEI